MRSGSESIAHVSRWASSRPFAIDVTLATVVGGFGMLGYYSADVLSSQRPQDLAGAAIIVGQTIGFSFRRRRPMPAFLFVIACTIVFWVADYPTNFDAFSLLAVYAATAHGGDDRRRVWTITGAVVALLTTIALLGVIIPDEDLPAAAVIGIAALHLTAAVAGEIVHERRQRLDALEQRAERAEAERELLAREAVLEERARIARDLHDIVAHGMSVMVVQAGAAQRVVATQPERAAQSLEHIQATGREALAEMRRLLGVLRNDGESVELSPQPSIDDLGRIVQHCVDAGIPTELSVSGQTSASAPGAEMTGYRIVQEALTNVIKHAGRPTRAAVNVAYESDRMRIEVVDDGTGASVTELERTTGHGLVGMRERVDLYGGSFHAGPRPGGGFRVAATIPIDAVRRAS